MRIAVCDDEKLFRNQTISCIKAYDKNYRIYEYKSAQELLRSKKDFDIIFLDIEMPGIDGMAAAKELRSNGIESIIIFLTSHAELVYDSFKVDAFRFLNKPVNPVAFKEAIDDATVKIISTEKLVINQKGKLHNANLKDIVYLEAFGDGTYIYDKRGNVYETSIQLKEWEQSLQEKNFFKIHKSYIVSLMYVKNLEDGKLELNYSNTVLTVSRRNLKSFREAYMEFIRSHARVI